MREFNPADFKRLDVPPRRRAHFANELKSICEVLSKHAGDWYLLVKADLTDREKNHRRRLSYRAALERQGVDGYEFTVRQGALYGRKGR